MLRFSLALILCFATGGALAQDDICTSSTNTFTVKVNLFESEIDGFESGLTGYYYFEECGNVTNPTIGIEIGETYTFDQGDVSNYYHPMGFAYFPDGDHVEKDELEPGVSQGTSGCDETLTCPAPMYFVGGKYVGKYSNIDTVMNTTTNVEDFGLDSYEPVFFYPLGEWAGLQPFSIQLHFDDETYTKDIFYFCHIHEGMSARIKLLKNGVPINDELTPSIDYIYTPASDFDKKCGTYQLGDYTLPQSQCPETFVCDTTEKSNDVQAYTNCLNALDCKMFTDMTTSVASDDAVDLFIHQMVPHHENAINMAKALLKLDLLPCDDHTSNSIDCAMNNLLRGVINNQNEQIMAMNGILKRKSVELKAGGCNVEVQSSLMTTGSRMLRF
ncbi:hypothetical protein MPSEU_000758700 [Mayamaea pseudoterrestris]|nr:hypothetical protein MPSEU_000758700 [Mayamaea pseudoterrestris]